MRNDIEISGDMPEEGVDVYVDYLENKCNRKIKSLDIKIDEDDVELRYRFTPVPFERLRRITGYLTSDLNQWNNAKRAEEKDRVKHDLPKGGPSL